MFDVRALSKKNPLLPKSLKVHQAERACRVACQVLSRVDRTLSGDLTIRVRPNVDDEKPYPAWTTPDGIITIDFCSEVFGTIHGDAAFVHMLGLNHHELAHLLYTPLWTDVPGIATRGNGNPAWANAYNMLEDGRIERLMGIEYESVRPMLLSVFMNVIATIPKASLIWPITAPRRSVLPKKVYETIRKATLAEGMFTRLAMNRMQKIATKYLNLVPVNQEQQAIDLVDEYAKIIESYLGNEKATPHALMHEAGSLAGNYRRKPKRSGGVQRALLDKVTQESGDPTDGDDDTDDVPTGALEPGPATDSGDDDPDEGGGVVGADSGDDADDGPEGDSDGPGTGGRASASDGSEKSDGDDLGDGDPVGEGGSGASSTGHGDDAVAPTVQDIRDALDAAQTDIMTSEPVVNELTNHSRAMRNGSSFVTTVMSKRTKSIQMPTQDMQRAAKKVGIEFSKLASQLDPGWNRMTPAGKLNVKRYLDGADLDVVFDQWREDHSDATDVEAFLALDLSSSMDHDYTRRVATAPYVEAAKAFWVLRKALAVIGAKVTGYGFTDSASVLFKREDRLPRSGFQIWGASGGTNPETTIDDACILLGRSRARSKIFVALTDGEWAGDTDAMANMLDDMRARGVVTCQFRIGAYRDAEGIELLKHFDVVAEIADPMGMVQPVKDTIKQLIKRKAGRS